MLISFKKEEYSNNGRPLFRKLSKQEIIDYLGLENASIDIFIDFKKLENKYFNKNVDIWLNEDIPIYSGNDIRVIEISKFVSIVKKI